MKSQKILITSGTDFFCLLKIEYVYMNFSYAVCMYVYIYVAQEKLL